MINHRSLRPIHEVHRTNRIQRRLRNGGHCKKVRVEILVECGAISEDLSEGGNGSSGGSNDRANQLIVRYGKGPSLVSGKRVLVVHILHKVISM